MLKTTTTTTPSHAGSSTNFMQLPPANNVNSSHDNREKTPPMIDIPLEPVNGIIQVLFININSNS